MYGIKKHTEFIEVNHRWWGMCSCDWLKRTRDCCHLVVIIGGALVSPEFINLFILVTPPGQKSWLWSSWWSNNACCKTRWPPGPCCHGDRWAALPSCSSWTFTGQLKHLGWRPLVKSFKPGSGPYDLAPLFPLSLLHTLHQLDSLDLKELHVGVVPDWRIHVTTTGTHKY